MGTEWFYCLVLLCSLLTIQTALNDQLVKHEKVILDNAKYLEEDVLRMREMERRLRVKRRELRPLKLGIVDETRTARLEYLYNRARVRETSAIKCQKVFRGHRVRKALAACGGVNYWEQTWDSAVVRFVNDDEQT